MGWFAVVVALVAGAANPFQSAAHGQLNKQLHQPVWAAIAVYLLGLLSLLAVQAFVREPWPFGSAGSVSWWAWTGGVLSIFSTLAAILLVQKLGSGIFTGLSVTASLLISVVLDQFGWMGLKQHPMSMGRGFGCALLVAGVWLMSRS